jgi:hypothetical protein
MAAIAADPKSYSWRTTSSKAPSAKSTRAHVLQPTQSVVLPAATLEAASHRISLIYKDMVFDDGPDEESFSSLHDTSEDEVEVSVFRGVGAYYLFTIRISLTIRSQNKRR